MSNSKCYVLGQGWNLNAIILICSSHGSTFTGWEHNFSHPSWITAVCSPPAAASSSPVLIDKSKHQPIGKKMNGGKVMRIKKEEWTLTVDNMLG